MFELAKLRDTVHIAPSEFGKSTLTSVINALSEKYPNKVVPGLGLCVTVYDVLLVGEAHLYPGNASQHMVVEFRIVVFRPYAGEVLTGTLVASDPQGMRISLGFFDEIQVPSHLLQPPSYWSADECVWVWNVTPEHQLFYDLENELRFRVVEVKFREERAVPVSSQPGAAGSAASVSAFYPASASATAAGTAPEPAPAPEPAMLIVAGLDRSSLGLTTWWPADELDAEGPTEEAV